MSSMDAQSALAAQPRSCVALMTDRKWNLDFDGGTYQATDTDADGERPMAMTKDSEYGTPPAIEMDVDYVEVRSKSSRDGSSPRPGTNPKYSLSLWKRMKQRCTRTPGPPRDTQRNCGLGKRRSRTPERDERPSLWRRLFPCCRRKAKLCNSQANLEPQETQPPKVGREEKSSLWRRLCSCCRRQSKQRSIENCVGGSEADSSGAAHPSAAELMATHGGTMALCCSRRSWEQRFQVNQAEDGSLWPFDFTAEAVLHCESSRQLIHENWCLKLTGEFNVLQIVPQRNIRIQEDCIEYLPNIYSVLMIRTPSVTMLQLKVAHDIGLTANLNKLHMVFDTWRKTVERLQNVSYSDEIKVDKKLLGRAIGKKGKNLRQAKKIPGITKIIFDCKHSLFQIYGDTSEAVQSARRLLEYSETYLQVPKELLPAVIGKGGRKVNQLQHACGLNVVKVLENPDDEETVPRQIGHLPLLLRGTKQSVDKALGVFGSYLKELEEHRSKESEPWRQLNNKSEYTVVFSIPRKLLGLAIGAKGTNLQRAREVVGIKCVGVDDKTCRCVIKGETEESVAQARQIMELTEQCVQIPTSVIPRVVGRRGLRLRQITSECGVKTAKLLNDVHEEVTVRRQRGCTPLLLTGSRVSVEAATVRLQDLIATLQRNDTLKNQRKR